uniref:rhomboid protease n=1 Tax=Salmo trutta TaxID=8032 RepID=A0A674C2R1_SALTR
GSWVCYLQIGSDIISTATRGNRFTLNTQQRCSFRKAAKETNTKKGPSVAYTHPRSFSRLVKPLVFTIGFTACSFGTAAIWQYESLKSRVQSYFDEERANWLEKLRPQKQGDLRKRINQWWNSLSEGQRTVTGIIAANAVVFCCWRVPSLQRSMIKYFTSNPASKTLCFPMLLSTFSHYSFFHMAANMYVLWSFSSSIVSMLGREQFMAVYVSAGVISTMFSYVCKTASGRLSPSLGASGAKAKLAIIFFPMYAFSAGNALKAIVAMDTAGLVLGWRYFDHAAHLGGAIFGIWYIMYGHELIWKNREPLVKVWHDLRTKGPGGGGNGGSGPL